MNIKETRELLNKEGLEPRKGLGQNFLFEKSIIKKLADAAEITPNETVVEIGPGTGNLTEELQKKAGKLIVIEKDPAMANIIRQRFKTSGNIEISQGDALLFDETKIPAPYKVAANLPFYITAPVIRKFLESANPPLSLTVIVQKEVAQRICAKPPQMSLLAVSVQFYATCKIVSHVPKNCFWPSPKVDCSILQIVPLAREGEREDKEFIKQFFKVVKAGFSHPRKQLANNLSTELKTNRHKIEQLLSLNNVQPTQRAETLEINHWKILATCLLDKNRL